MEMTEALVKDEEDLIAQVLKVKKECWIELMLHPANPRRRAAREGSPEFPLFKVASVLDL